MMSLAAAISPFAYPSMVINTTNTINAPSGWKYAIMELYIAGWIPYSPMQTIEPGKTNVPIGSTTGSSSTTFFHYTTTDESITIRCNTGGSIAGCLYWYV